MSKYFLIFLIFFQISFLFSLICKYETEILIGNRCYSFVPKKLSFKSAQKYCKNEGYNLATVDNAIIDNFLASSASSHFGKSSGEFWIGLHRQHDYSLFEWEDGTLVGFTNFQSGFPNHHDFVAEQMSNGKWKTISEHSLLDFICSYFPNSTTTTTTTTTTTMNTPKTLLETTKTPSPTKKPGCPEGFTLFEQKCYIVLIYGYDKDYPNIPNDAPPLTREAQRCAKYGAKLATVHSSDLNNILRSLIYDVLGDSQYATIGLLNTDKTVRNGNWKWYDNSTTDFLMFGEGFPKTGDSIAQASLNGYWISFTHTSPGEGVVCYVDY